MLEVCQISKTYPGPVRALDSVDLRIDSGIFGLLGPNGAGKSTFMRILATLQLPDSGNVALDGHDLFANLQEARRSIGYLPQEMGAYPRASARELLNYLAALKGITSLRQRKALVEEQLSIVNLRDVADRRLETYSGGMRQRFGIASAFLGNPKLVIVDEPTAGLDPIERRRFQRLLVQAAKNCVMILSSHIVEDVVDICDQIGIMADGKIVARGSPQNLVQSLENCVWTRTVPEDKLGQYETGYRLLSVRPDAGSFSVRLFATEADHSHLSGLGFQRADPDLEDVYAHLVTSSQAIPIS